MDPPAYLHKNIYIWTHPTYALQIVPCQQVVFKGINMKYLSFIGKFHFHNFTNHHFGTSYEAYFTIVEQADFAEIVLKYDC